MAKPPKQFCGETHWSGEKCAKCAALKRKPASGQPVGTPPSTDDLVAWKARALRAEAELAAVRTKGAERAKRYRSKET